jgi:hypothetical protein
LLRAHHERPCGCRTAEQRDEVSPSHELSSDEAHNLAHYWTMLGDRVELTCDSCRRIETFSTRLSDWRRRFEQPMCASRHKLKNANQTTL